MIINNGFRPNRAGQNTSRYVYLMGVPATDNTCMIIWSVTKISSLPKHPYIEIYICHIRKKNICTHNYHNDNLTNNILDISTHRYIHVYYSSGLYLLMPVK